MREKIFNDLKNGTNIDLYVTVVLAILITILNLVGMTLVNKNVPSLTMGLLALISFSLLVSRHQIEKVLENVLGRKDAVIVEDFDWIRLNEDVEICEELMLQGVSLLSHFENNLEIYTKKVSKGHTINVLLVDKNSPALLMAANRDQICSAEYQVGRIEHTLGYLKELKKKGAKIVAKSINNPLDFETIVCTKGSKKTIYLRHYGFKTQNGNEPKIVIDNNNNASLYEYFSDHIANIWKNADEIDLT